MSDSDDYHSSKIQKKLKRKQTHKTKYQDSDDDSNMKNRKISKKSSRRVDSFEDSGRESDDKREHKSKRRTKDEKHAKEQRSNETDEYVSRKRNVQDKEFDFESRSNSKSRDKADDTRNSEKVKEVDKRKDKHRDKENNDRQKYTDPFKETMLLDKGRRTDYQEKEKKKKHQEKGRKDYQKKDRKDYQGRERKDNQDRERKDYQDRERKNFQEKERNDYQGRERKEDNQDRERNDYQDRERNDYQDRERNDYQDRERNDYQDRERNDYQDRERKDYQDRERKGYQERERKDYQERERKDYRDKETNDSRDNDNEKYKFSSRPKRKHRSESDGELPVSRQEKRYSGEIMDKDKAIPAYGKDAEPISADIQEDPKKVDDVEPLSKRQKMANINVRTGGAYIPPARLRMMQEKIQDKGSEEYQRIAWEALKKSIVGMTNKINSSNIGEIIPELFKENIIRGRGVLVRAIMQAQSASPTFTPVYAALVAIINTKFPEIGELLLKRLIIQYKRGFRRNDKTICMTAARFIAHLLNQEVAHEVLILEMVTHLLENPSEDSVEVAISTLKECGQKLTELTARGVRAMTERVRDVLHEGKMDVRVRYMIEVFFAVQKDKFKDFKIIPEELDLIEEDDKYTHLINLDDAVDGQDVLNVFKFDPLYVENEEKYKAVAKEILEGPSDSEDSGDESDDEEEEAEEKDDESQQIIDMTETNVVCLRRKIYLTVQSSLDFEECAHKLLRLELKPGQILEMCYMILDCCAQQRTYEKFFGLLAQRFCQLSKIYVEPFTEIFENSYKTIHRLETNKLRNVAKFFAHLLYTDAISWMVLANIKLNEEDTTSSSRIFIKILFQELCEYMGLSKLNDRVKDVTLQEAFDGLFPRDHPHNTRFAINFFTSIGLGGLTDELREHLKNLPKNPVVADTKTESSPKESSSSSSSLSSSSSTSDSSSSDSDDRKSKRKGKPTRRK